MKVVCDFPGHPVRISTLWELIQAYISWLCMFCYHLAFFLSFWPGPPSYLQPSYEAFADSAFPYPHARKILHLLWILKFLRFYLCVKHPFLACKGSHLWSLITLLLNSKTEITSHSKAPLSTPGRTSTGRIYLVNFMQMTTCKTESRVIKAWTYSQMHLGSVLCSSTSYLCDSEQISEPFSLFQQLKKMELKKTVE